MSYRINREGILDKNLNKLYKCKLQNISSKTIYDKHINMNYSKPVCVKKC